MSGFLFEETLGYEIAEKLGLEAFCVLGQGLDGKVWALKDGRVMKITFRPGEAVIAKMLLDGATTHTDVFGRIDDVRALGPIEGRNCYLIIREDIADPFPDPTEEEMAMLSHWKAAANYVSHCLNAEDEELLQFALTCFQEGTPRPSVMVDGLSKLAEEFDIRPADVWASNMGINTRGNVVIRDFGQFKVPHELLTRTLAEIPELAVVLEFGPQNAM